MNEHDAKLTYLKQRPQTNVEKLRSDLDQLEKLVGSLRYLEAEDVKKIPQLFDQVDEGFEIVDQSGTDLKGERTQWETVSHNFEKQAASFIRILGGRETLHHLRSVIHPKAEQWWWYPDRLLTQSRKSQAMRVGFWIGLAVVILGVLGFLYQSYLAPDEATQVSLQHSFNAENLADKGDYQAAYVEIDLAIEAKPGQPDLYLLKGVLAEQLGMPETAAQAFKLTEVGSPDHLTFLLSRASEYLRFGLYERAINEAQTALNIDPEQSSAYLILGQAYESSGDYQNALDNYRLADKLATEQDNVQVQVISRMSIGQLYNKLPAVAPTDAVIPAP